MAILWIIQNGQVVFTQILDTKGKSEREKKIEAHKVIIKALKEISGK